MLAWLTLRHFGGAEAMVTAIQTKFGPSGAEILGSVPPRDHAAVSLSLPHWAGCWGRASVTAGDAAPMGGAMEGQRILSTRTPAEALTM